MDTRNGLFQTGLLSSNILQCMYEIGSFRSGDDNEDRGELFFNSSSLTEACKSTQSHSYIQTNQQTRQFRKKEYRLIIKGLYDFCECMESEK